MKHDMETFPLLLVWRHQRELHLYEAIIFKHMYWTPFNVRAHFRVGKLEGAQEYYIVIVEEALSLAALRPTDERRMICVKDELRPPEQESGCPVKVPTPKGDITTHSWQLAGHELAER